jgi:hypothetical protein
VDVIRAEQVTKSYGRARGVVGLDLSVEQGRYSASSVRTVPASRRRSDCYST